MSHPPLLTIDSAAPATPPAPPTSPTDDRPLRAWSVAVGLLLAASGMAYSLWWPVVVRHRGYYWLTSSDFWSTYRNAHYVAWGGLSYIYDANTHLVTLPGFPILMAPVAALTGALGLTESAPQVVLFRPEAWLIAGPLMMLTAIPALLGADAVARRLAIPRGRRRVLTVLEAGCLWPALAWWGHPEDVLCVGLLLLGMAALSDGRDTAAGWLLGGAVAIQLLAVLVVPVLLLWAGRRRLLPLLLRAAVLPFFCLAVTIPDFHQAWAALTRQPNFPLVDHPTPWMSLSPSLGHHVVAAGPARLIGMSVALLCGLLAAYRRPGMRTVVWLVAAAFAARCIFEAVMVPYYVMPAVAVALIVLCTLPLPRLILGAAAGAAVTVTTFLHAGPWTYWGGMTALLVVMLALGWPGWRPAADGVVSLRARPAGERVEPAAAAPSGTSVAGAEQAPAVTT